MDTEMMQSPPQSPAEELPSQRPKKEMSDKQLAGLAAARQKAVEVRRARAAEKQQEKEVEERQKELEKLKLLKRSEALEAELQSLQAPQPKPEPEPKQESPSPEKPRVKQSKKRRVVREVTDSDTDIEDAEDELPPPRAPRQAAIRYQPAPADFQRAWEEQQARAAVNQRIRQYRQQVVNSTIFPYLR
jgi:hypothetical protein